MNDAGVRKFEDLIAWQKARVLTKQIYLLSKQAPFSKDFGLSGQIQRAAVSIMSNIAEGFDRASSKEYLQFLAIAQSSCSEVISHLYVAYDIDYLPEPQFLKLRSQVEEITRIIGGLQRSIKKCIVHSE